MLANKTVLITGSTSGIGYAIAEAFAQQNVNVIINGIEILDNGNPLLTHLSSKTQGIVHYESIDLTDIAAIEAMMTRNIERFGAIDVVVNNACIQYVSPVEQFPIQKWNQILALGLTAAFHTTRLALPGMREKGWGRIINIASAHGLVASAEKSAYVPQFGITIKTYLSLTFNLKRVEFPVACDV